MRLSKARVAILLTNHSYNPSHQRRTKQTEVIARMQDLQSLLPKRKLGITYPMNKIYHYQTGREKNRSDGGYKDKYRERKRERLKL